MDRQSLIPESVNLRIPQNKDEADCLRNATRMRFDAWISQFGPWPKSGSLQIKVHSERGRYHGVAYLELLVSYTGEIGESISAYLLIPAEGRPPYPAVVANHQCFMDCDIGKDAVVGKSHLRPDQVYGFELVLRGYVVLAPDSVNCGVRNLPGVRKQGENRRVKKVCGDLAIPALSVNALYLKHMWDAKRAVDVLESLDYVDERRIGMIGHSMGASTTFWAAAFDDRIKASVLSCHFLGGLNAKGKAKPYCQAGDGLYYHELLALIVPRCVLATRGLGEKTNVKVGDFESAEDENAVFLWCYEYARHFCELYDAPVEHMEARLFDGGHSFPETEREYAYEWLDARLNDF